MQAQSPPAQWRTFKLAGGGAANGPPEAVIQEALAAAQGGSAVLLDLQGSRLKLNEQRVAKQALSRLLGRARSSVKLINGRVDFGAKVDLQIKGYCWMEDLVLTCEHHRPSSPMHDPPQPMLKLETGSQLGMLRCNMEQADAGEPGMSALNMPAPGICQDVGSRFTARYVACVQVPPPAFARERHHLEATSAFLPAATQHTFACMRHALAC